jgi:hypothetical protein
VEIVRLDDMNAKLRHKYIGMLVREPADDDGEDEMVEADYVGRVVDIEFKAKNQGVYKKGYYAKTEEMDEVPGRLYVINASLHDMIKIADNDGFIFQQSSGQRVSATQQAEQGGAISGNVDVETDEVDEEAWSQEAVAQEVEEVAEGLKETSTDGQGATEEQQGATEEQQGATEEQQGATEEQEEEEEEDAVQEEGEGDRVGRKRKTVCHACVSCSGMCVTCKKANSKDKAEAAR